MYHMYYTSICTINQLYTSSNCLKPIWNQPQENVTKFLQLSCTKWGWCCFPWVEVLDENEMEPPYLPVQCPVEEATMRGGWVSGATSAVPKGKPRSFSKGNRTMDFPHLCQFTLRPWGNASHLPFVDEWHGMPLKSLSSHSRNIVGHGINHQELSSRTTVYKGVFGKVSVLTNVNIAKS